MELDKRSQLYECLFNCPYEGRCSICPTSEKHGHWEHYLKEGLKWRCSECASRFTTPFDYCPHCGAKMTLD